MNLAVPHVDMVSDAQLPRERWPIGKVTRLIPSEDGRIMYIRPVAKQIPLPLIADSETTQSGKDKCYYQICYHI